MFGRIPIRDKDAKIFNRKGQEKYINACLKDLRDITDFVYNYSRFTNQKDYPKNNFIFNHSKSLKFEASISWVNNNIIEFNLPLGLLLSIDDLCLRLASNMDFFSFDPLDDGKRKWFGSSCQWNIPYGGLKPRFRFIDYSPVEIKPSEMIARPYGTYISNYIEVFPYDSERLKLYRYMLLIAYSWVFLHEEGHYSGGHLFALKNGKKGEVPLSTHKNKTNPFNDKMIFKSAEWEADRSATSGVVDLFLTNEWNYFLPSYAKPNFRWQARIILTLIGAIIEVIQKSRIISQTKSNYPSPRTRLISSAFHFHNRMISNDIFNKHSVTFDDICFIYLGAFDDLYTVSDLMNREGNIGVWNEKMPPVQENLRSQKLFDTPYESKATFQLFINRLQNGTNKYDNKVQEKLYKKWFLESQNISFHHREVFWPYFSKYRKLTGMPND